MKELLVEIDGRSLKSAEILLLSEVRVQQKLSLPTLCEIAFLVGPDSQLYQDMKIGGKVVIRTETHRASGTLFEGAITGREHVYNPDEGPQLRVRAYDGLHRLRKRQQVVAHVNTSLNELANKLLREAGISASVSVTGVGALPVWQRLIQDGKSSFDFLDDRCAACGVCFTLRGKKFHLLTLKGFGDPVPLKLSETLLEASIEVNGNRSSRKTSASTWNPRRAESLVGTAAQARSGRKVTAEAPPRKLGGMPDVKLLGDTVEDLRQAEALAQAELDLRAAQEVTLTGVALGDPRLGPGTKVNVEEVSPEVAGQYVLTEATHVMTGESGYVTEITTEPAEARPRPRGTIAVLGKVTRVNDPEGFGRVQVSLPAYNDAETDWMQVVVPGAGKKKGIISLPNVGDMVLVLCACENPAQGVVLGGLFGVEAPPDTGVEGGKTQRFSVYTAGGHHLFLDDAKDVLRIEGSKGSYLEFTPSRVLLHAGANLEIEAPGKSVTVKGSKIDFKRG